MSNIPLFKGGKNIKSVCYGFCVAEERQDLRIIHIPRDMWQAFIKRKTDQKMENTPLFVGVRATNNPNGKKFYFGCVEPSFKTINSEHTDAILPEWLFSYLDMDIIDSYVDIIFLSKPKNVNKIILKGNKSSYVKTDIKTDLEIKIGSWNCINNNEKFTVNDVEFTVVGLKSIDNEDMDFGSIFNLDEVKLEFEEPDDIKELRMKEEKKEKIHFGAHVSGFNQPEKPVETSEYKIFQTQGLKLGDPPKKPLTKAEILEARLKKISEIKEN